MDVLQPPVEPEVKNIIDKLANFVARNGAEFEKMTKEKQKGNPKFSFLFGGEHYNYYQYKLSTEQQIQNQQKAKLNAQVVAQEAMVQHSLQNAPWQRNPQQQQSQQQAIPPLMPQFPRFPPNMRMPMSNAPPWQPQSQRFMPPNSGPNMHQPPPPFPGPGNNQTVPNMPMPPNQQMGGQPPPQNFNMPYRQPPQNMPPRTSRFSQLPPEQSQTLPSQNQEPEDKKASDLSQGKGEEGQENEEYQIVQAENEAKIKIEKSSSNLKQQYEVLMHQQQEKIDAAIAQTEEEKLRNLASSTGIITSDFDVVLQPIINTCTKDSISAGKSWILSNSKSAQHCEVIGRHLLKRILEAEKMADNETVNGKSKFDTQLHIVYLVNDVLHHASRKHIGDLSSALQSVILPIFCMANANAPEARRERLTKLLGLWQKFKYFNEDILEKLKDPPTALSEYQANLIIEHAAAVQQVQTDIQNQYNQYEEQHKQYASHIESQIKERRDAFEKRKEDEKRAKDEERNAQSQDYDQNQYKDNAPPWASGMDDYDNNTPMQFEYGHGANNQTPQVIDYSHSRNPSEWQEEEFGPRLPWGGGQGPRMGGPWQDGSPWAGGGPRPRGPRAPPPQMNPNDPSLIPSVPYYDLPSGLMCPLVKLEDMDYKSLDPAMIRLPPPVPPSERLLAAVEAFYGPPSHERPRNVDGWERNGLFEFYRAKVRAKQRKDGNLSRSKSKSRSRSRERSLSRSRSRGRSYSRSSSSGSRSRSRSSRSRSRSRSPKNRSLSPSRRRKSGSRSLSPENRRSRSPDRQRSRSPIADRDLTPPSMGGNVYAQALSMEGKLGEENRGAQMLKRMGWGGAGLGAKEQGREDPISAGEIRDKYDQFKGLGMPTDDPYESFRKSKSQGFITRIKARDKERGTPRRSRRDEEPK
uniref:calcium homeostasis endoplasmic reticulum protein-like n=1 Tax=Styela clava TaxID=7725 RepID=UPI001939E419|nr:calcium homeostasis endoplasmic reticulum protein-like [Styela clava]